MTKWQTRLQTIIGKPLLATVQKSLIGTGILLRMDLSDINPD
jgi:hypothetical protein